MSAGGFSLSQRLVFGVIAALLLLMTLFPPFSARYEDMSGFLGYAPIWAPPGADRARGSGVALDRARSGPFPGYVDVRVWLAQVVSVTLVGVLAALAVGGREN